MIHERPPDFTLPAGPLRIVYVVRRGTEVLYVGASRVGLARPLRSNHHVLARRVQPGDVIDIYHVADGVSLVRAERDAIQALKPKWNRVAWWTEVRSPLTGQPIAMADETQPMASITQPISRDAVANRLVFLRDGR